MQDAVPSGLTQQRLDEGLRAGELRLLYQPRVDMRGDRVAGVEALLRWRHPELGELAPAAFLPLAQEHELIAAIGDWTIREALRQMALWRAQGLDLTVGVNVASAYLLHPDFPAALRGCLDAAAGADPARLELEILESACPGTLRQAREQVERCSEWGVSFVLDAFGSGCSSLSFLHQVPVGSLKIDRGLVRDLLGERNDARAMVAAVIGLARAARREVTAVGVEHPVQGAVLLRLGCDIAQGYGIAPPLPAADVPGWVAAYRPDAEWRGWMDVPWEMDELPLLAARSDHEAYAQRFLDYAEGRAPDAPAAALEDHPHCRFGRWYAGPGRMRYGDLPEFQAVEEAHERLHALAAAVLRQGADGRADARALRDARDEVAERLKGLEQRVGSLAADRRGIAMSELPAPGRSADGGAETRPIRILIVDDAPTNIELLAGALSSDYTVTFATSGPKALEMASKPEKPDLILLDIEMPDMDGYEVCRRLKAEPATRDIPVIFVTARGETDEQIRGFGVGGVDFITKPVRVPIVQARVRIHLNLKFRAELLERQASLDGLTGVPNRRRWDEVLAREWRRARRQRLPISLLMIDTDHFKQFNDRYGHGAGDDCLRRISTALNASLRRPGDFLARYGGEEFSAILTGCDAPGARAQAERMRAAVEALRIPHADSAAGHVTVSVGCATGQPADDEGFAQLLAAADRALYRAKADGRNRVFCAADGEDAAARP